MLDVVLAAPHHFDRLADGFGCFHCFGDKVGFATPAESAAEISRVDVHSLGGETGCRDRRLMRRGLPLGGHPDVAAVGTHIRCAVHRLHTCVGEKGCLENPLETAGRARHRRGRVAIVARDFARLLGQRGVFLQDVGAGQIRKRPFIPFHLESLCTL